MASACSTLTALLPETEAVEGRGKCAHQRRKLGVGGWRVIHDDHVDERPEHVQLLEPNPRQQARASRRGHDAVEVVLGTRARDRTPRMKRGHKLQVDELRQLRSERPCDIVRKLCGRISLLHTVIDCSNRIGDAFVR